MRDRPYMVRDSLFTIDTDVEINLQSLVTPGKNTIKVQLPKLDYPYYKDTSKDTIVEKEYIIENEVEGTPIQIMNTIYAWSRNTVKANFLKKKIEGKHTILLGKNIIIVDNKPVFLVVQVYNTSTKTQERRVLLSDMAFTESSPTLNYLLKKIIPAALSQGNNISVVWCNPVMEGNTQLRRRLQPEAVQETLLNHLTINGLNCQ